MIIAGIAAMFLLCSCASSSDGIYLQRANCKISPNLHKEADGYKLDLVFENKSEKSVRLQNPACLNRNTVITVRNSSGEEISQQMDINPDACGEYIVLKPGEKRSFALPYTLEVLYGLKTPGEYKVILEYVGGLYEENGTMYGDQILRSSAAEFAVK